MKVSEYITRFLEINDIDTIFTITGGFAMHLNDSFGRSEKLKKYYQHHEQACGYSAVGYTKTVSKPCVVCTTAGCAATNTITPCLVAHQDSCPVFFITGQAKSTECITAINTEKMKLRHYAGADCDIISMVSPITKYCKEILSVDEVVPAFEEAMRNLITGRPGPVWISIPVDIQAMNINKEPERVVDITHTRDYSNLEELAKINTLLQEAKRPIVIAGNGINLGNCSIQFREFIKKYRIPVVCSFFGTDVLESDDNLFCGKIGLIGDRAGNFAMQNSDLILSLGCRMSQGIIGYRPDWFARAAKIVYIDNDQNELEKTNIKYTLKINMDLNVFFEKYNFEPNEYDWWIEKCKHWKTKWLYEIPEINESIINPYTALRAFFDKAPENKSVVVSSGSIITNVWHMVSVKKYDKFLISSQGDMGFELTASIGASIADPSRTVFPILGEGSLQLNIQELQTIVHYKLPIKILLFNNNAYGAIEITQSNFFKQKFGVDESSGLSFPDTEKICGAYGIPYLSVKENDKIDESINIFLNSKGPILLEVFCCIQGRYPRLNAIKNEDGTFTNRPFEDMDPFMSREEFKNEMIIDIV
jgi:acetolactate synthase-1/2/3 large subunit